MDAILYLIVIAINACITQILLDQQEIKRLEGEKDEES